MLPACFITLPDRLAIAGNQEWRVNSATGGITQIQDPLVARQIKLGGNTLILNAVQAGNYFRFDAPISGAGGLVIRGAGTTFLSGVSTYSSGTLIDGGALTIAADNNLGNVVGGVSCRGGTLHTTGSFTTARAFALEAGTATFNTDAATTLILTTAIGGAGGLIKAGDGTLQLGGANGFTGETNIAKGILVLTGAGGIAASQRVVVDGVLDIAATTSGASLQRLSGAGDILVGPQPLTLTNANANANDTFSGKFSGTGHRHPHRRQRRALRGSLVHLRRVL